MSTQNHNPARGFTVPELLLVVVIISLLAVVVAVAVFNVRNRARYSRSIEEFYQISAAMELYKQQNGNYPDDVSRGLPNGLERYITGGVWPAAAYPNSVFDWDNWPTTMLTYPPLQNVVQISIRFCPAGGPLSACVFPNEPWASGFGVNSSLYYCVSGPCRAHSSEVSTYPAYCVNC